jgi:hypothetical protein
MLRSAASQLHKALAQVESVCRPSSWRKAAVAEQHEARANTHLGGLAKRQERLLVYLQVLNARVAAAELLLHYPLDHVLWKVALRLC